MLIWWLVMDKQKKTEFDMAVINRVIKKREELGLSQYDIATMLELSRGFIGQIESPKFASKYNLNHLNKLAFEMGCSPQDFIPKTVVKEKDWK